MASMSTSLLYHGFGVRGYECVRAEYVGGEVHFTVRQPRKALRCPACGSRDVRLHGTVERRVRTVPIGPKAVFVGLAIPRVCCPRCGVTRQVKVDFADPRRSYTKAFERSAPGLSRHMTLLDVARHLGVCWDVIKGIQKRDREHRYARPELGGLRRIAIDEISVGKGRRYLTVVLDPETGAVVFVGDGRGGDALKPFRERLRRSGARVAAVAMDMSPACRQAVSTHLEGAVVVSDHFHVIELFNEKLSDLRRSLSHRATEEQKLVLKGVRWRLLKSPETRDPERDGAGRLKEALSLNLPLTTASYLKDDLRQFGEPPGERFATAFLRGWLRRARASGVPMPGRMADTLEAHADGRLADSRHPISTGPLEGTNHKIPTMSRQAYGFRDREFSELKTLAIHETRDTLVG
jgi:transposase